MQKKLYPQLFLLSKDPFLRQRESRLGKRPSSLRRRTRRRRGRSTSRRWRSRLSQPCCLKENEKGKLKITINRVNGIAVYKLSLNITGTYYTLKQGRATIFVCGPNCALISVPQAKYRSKRLIQS